MTAYMVELCCPKCGAELEHVNGRQPGNPGLGVGDRCEHDDLTKQWTCCVQNEGETC